MKRIAFLGAALLAVLPALGLAADAPAPTSAPVAAPADAGAEPEIVVTARRAPEEAGSTGSSVTVIDRQEIDERQYQNVTDALSQVPGLYVAIPGTQGQSAILMSRGVTTHGNLILVNGHRLPQDTGGGYDLTNLSLDNVERIEVVRGPLSGVQGAGAAGSVINIVTLDGRDVAKPEYTASFEAGSYNTFHEVVTARGMQGPFDYSVAGSFLDTSNQRPNNDYQRGNFDGTVGWQIARDIRLTLDGGYRSSYTGQDGPSYGSSFSDPNDPDSWLLREVWRVSPTLEWKTTENWTQTLSYQRSEQRQFSFVGAQAIADGFNGGRSQTNSNQFTYDSRVAVADNLSLTQTLEGTNHTTWFHGDDAFFANGGADYHNAQTDGGVGAGLDYEPLKDWKIDPNFRVDRYSDYGVFTNWRVASSYRTPGTQTRLHASYGTSTTVPDEGNFILFSTFFPPNLALKPELSQGFDAGAEQPFFGGKWTLGATYFQNNLKDLIISDPITNQQVNVGEARTQGVELSSGWHPISEFDLTATYTYLDAENLSSGDQHLPVRPRNTATLSATGRPVKGVVLTAEGEWVNGVSATDPFFATVPVQDYYLTRLAASWQANAHLQLFARMENALNEKSQAQPGYPPPAQAFYGGFKVSY